MLFNSFPFAIFFVLVFSLYLLLGHKKQNRLLLAASCVFYGSWDWRFLLLMFASISIDYFCALHIHASDDPGTRKRFLLISIIVNLAVLGFFKYFNFFAENLHALCSGFGLHLPRLALNIILPLGISFYTFEAMSYIMDIYRRKMQPIKHYADYALFVTYFPHLIAGPIMRAKDLLPQICSPRTIRREQLNEGTYLFCWGLFEKIFIADNLAKVVNPVFSAEAPCNGMAVLLSLYAFAFQIFCDFDGYSNMARGLGKCMGFDIIINFNLPYFAVNPRDFWQRWHISLSTWLRDYLYIPLGGNKNGLWQTNRNLMLTMLLGGLWHGASWTFVLWGTYQGSLLLAHRSLTPWLGKIPSPDNVFAARLWQALKIIFFFHLVCLGWLLFRAQSLQQVAAMLKSLAMIPGDISGKEAWLPSLKAMTVILPLLIIQSIQYAKKDLLCIFRAHWAVQGAFYFLILFLSMTLGADGGKEFIYFQF